jgi:hypothetical protein
MSSKYGFENKESQKAEKEQRRVEKAIETLNPIYEKIKDIVEDVSQDYLQAHGVRKYVSSQQLGQREDTWSNYGTFNWIGPRLPPGQFFYVALKLQHDNTPAIYSYPPEVAGVISKLTGLPTSDNSEWEQ